MTEKIGLATNVLLRYLTLALNADTLVDAVPAECPVMGWHQQLSFYRGCGALQVTWLVGYANVII